MTMLWNSCHSDVEDVTVTGTIYDTVTQKPIPNAEVTVTCWKYGHREIKGPDYDEQEVQKLTSDSAGNFLIHFDQGDIVDIDAEHELYHDQAERIKLRWYKSNYHKDLYCRSKSIFPR